MTQVYVLFSGAYDRVSAYGAYETREAAEAALPGARWFDGVAYHPVFDIRWRSRNCDEPWIEEWVVHSAVEPSDETPEGPMHGPKRLKCEFRQEWPQMYCTLDRGHGGDHHLRHGCWTSSNLGFIGGGLVSAAENVTAYVFGSDA